MGNGWVKLHRQFLENHMWQKDHNAVHVFMTLLLLVNKKNGEWAGGRKQLSSWTGLKDTTTYGALKRLEKAKMVTLTSNNKYSVIHICNWNEYQSDGNRSHDNTMTASRQPDDTLTRIKNKNKNINTSKTSEIFVDLVATLKLTRATFTPERKKKLEARLKRYTADELKQVAEALANDAYMQGDNDAHKKYATIDYLIRNDEKIDYWLEQSSSSKGYTGKLSDIRIEGDLK